MSLIDISSILMVLMQTLRFPTVNRLLSPSLQFSVSSLNPISPSILWRTTFLTHTQSGDSCSWKYTTTPSLPGEKAKTLSLCLSHQAPQAMIQSWVCFPTNQHPFILLPQCQVPALPLLFLAKHYSSFKTLLKYQLLARRLLRLPPLPPASMWGMLLCGLIYACIAWNFPVDLSISPTVLGAFEGRNCLISGRWYYRLFLFASFSYLHVFPLFLLII